MLHHEDNLQKACYQWFRLAYKDHLFWHTPNSEKRDVRRGARLKALGMVAGVPDIFIPEPKGRYHGLFIELKVGKRKVTEHQQNMIDELRLRGYSVHVCYSLDEFMEAVKWYFRA